MKLSYQSKYITLLKVSVYQFPMGYYQYPNTIMTTTDELSNHKLDPKFYENNKCSRIKALNKTEYKNSTEDILQINTHCAIVV